MIINNNKHSDNSDKYISYFKMLFLQSAARQMVNELFYFEYISTPSGPFQRIMIVQFWKYWMSYYKKLKK